MSNASDFIVENGVLKKYVGPGGDVKIPDGVTTIGDSAFRWCTSLESITLPDGVTAIGRGAFDDCTSLESIMIPDGVTTIGDSAFWYCSSLKSITLPDSVITIGDGAFGGCTGLVNEDGLIIVRDCVYGCTGGLENVVIPDGVTKISWRAFYGCFRLTSITIPDGVTEIGWGAFEGCTGLTSITIPDGVTEIGGGAFYGCAGLTSITIPDGVTEISGGAFEGCAGLTSITIPDSVTKIGSNAFWDCKELAELVLPETVTEIGVRAFSGCRKLNLVLPSKLKSIEEAAFRDCALTSIVIPAAVVRVGKDAFLRCNKIESAGPAGGGYDYEFTWTEEIPDNAFSGLRKLKRAELPATIKRIGNNAFKDCRELTELTMPKAAKVSKTAFKGCGKLEHIREPGAESDEGPAKTAEKSDFLIINGRLVEYRGKDKKIVIPEGVTVIGRGAFAGKRITSVTIPNGVTIIEEEAFESHWDLKTIRLPDTIERVGAMAFGWLDRKVESKLYTALPIRVFAKSERCGYGREDAVKHFCKEIDGLDSASKVYRDNVMYLGGHLKEYISDILAGSGKVLHILLESDAVPVKDVDAIISNLETYPHMVAELLDYKNRILSDPKAKKALQKSEEQAEEKALLGEMSVADWRKVFRFSYEEGEVVIKECRSAEPEILVPARIGSKTVRAIDSAAFCFGGRRKSPRSITFAEGIREIRGGTFLFVEDCEVYIPSTVTVLPRNFFDDVWNLSLHLTAFTELPEKLESLHSGTPIKVIYAPAGSPAEQYAKKNNIPFVAE